MTQKVQISQDTLYQFILDHNLKLVRLAELTGLSEASINRCFKHSLINGGVPHAFTRRNIAKLNDAIQHMADQLRQCVLTFGSEQTYTNRRGKTYDPALVEPVKRIGEWMNLTALVKRVLGWSKGKKECTLVTPSNKAYGCISREDAGRLNAELIFVAGVLSSYEVIYQREQTETGSSAVESRRNLTDGHIIQNKKGIEKNEWDDTSLDLLERYARFHRIFPDGVIAFSVNNGYTVCEDDARLFARVDSTLQLYIDMATGRSTLYMDAAKWEQMRRACDEEFVAVTPMYAE